MKTIVDPDPLFRTSPPYEAMNDPGSSTEDPFLLRYSTAELRIASEFLGNWLPFLSRDLCDDCTQTLTHRIRSLDPGITEVDVEPETLPFEDNPSPPWISNNLEASQEINENNNNHDVISRGSSKDEAETCSLGSWKDGSNECSGPIIADASMSSLPAVKSPSTRLSWADMAQEDELEGEEGEEEDKDGVKNEFTDGHAKPGQVVRGVNDQQKPELSREQRECIRFQKVQRKKDYICLERFNGKIVNILEGLELHSGVFSAVEQKKITDFVFALQEMGRKGELKKRTYSAPRKWMRGKGRVTLQFGCCYNYATDQDNNPPGILQRETVDPLPGLFKLIIKRLVRWHVLPPTCVPDSCIVNIYEEGDCIPPHIDNHDFVRPFCTVSFLSECKIVFGSNFNVVAPGEFSGAFPISLPVGSVLVLNGNGADVAKHCVPAVPMKRISITFRRMDEAKRPDGYSPESDLQGLQPLSYDSDKPKKQDLSKPQWQRDRQQMARRTRDYRPVEARGSPDGGGNYSEPRVLPRTRQVFMDRRKLRVSLGS